MSSKRYYSIGIRTHIGKTIEKVPSGTETLDRPPFVEKIPPTRGRGISKVEQNQQKKPYASMIEILISTKIISHSRYNFAK